VEENMTPAKSSGTSSAVRAPQPEEFHKALPRPLSAGDYLDPAVTETAIPDVLNQFSERFMPADTEAGPADFHEFRVLEQFLGRHVKQVESRDVQCMLLWSEWVRTFRRRTTGFPKWIREKEFRIVITDTFGTDTADRGFRGEVYTGIKFVP
jgi:hypothetical protein